ncbi:hypothetical protein [Actinopolymorpha rutila]|uniref:Uncharacterized protein n=1 Tax=Actinopolymorpha rutila TaxID=446787 RepID=A0A852ZKT8_9ACTN|nr:hypothetical protein [Actinopolymorpha rutila]NYH92735.1 hypothetical protein [Actinopolymorpha rutila]
MSDTPLYDQLVNERLGRGPSEFEGHDEWDDSEEARAAFERGVAQAHTLGEQSAGSEPAGSVEPSAQAKPGLENGPDRKQLEQQPVREQQPLPGQKQDEGQSGGGSASTNEPREKRTPGKPLAPA